MQISISVFEKLSADQISQVKKLVNSSTLVDEMAPLSEHVLIHINLGDGKFDEHILATSDSGQLVGYLHLDKSDEVSGPVVEVVVEPQFRGQKIELNLLNLR
jgi:mycothiol synthase